MALAFRCLASPRPADKLVIEPVSAISTRTMKLLRALALCMALSAAHAVAGPYEDGLAAYDRGEYAAALTLWRPLAEQGHRTAQFNVGVLHEKGLGVGQD